MMPLPCSAAKHPISPRLSKATAGPPRGARSPLPRPRMWPLRFYPLGHPLALWKKLPAGFSKSFSEFQVLEGERCAQLAKAKLPVWCHQIDLPRQLLAGTFCGAWCQQRVLTCTAWDRVRLSPWGLAGDPGRLLACGEARGYPGEQRFCPQLGWGS